MPADYTALTQRITDMTAEVTRLETTEAGVETLITTLIQEGKDAVAKALTADNAADQGSIDAANAALDQVAARFIAVDDKLGAAIVAGTPPAPTPAP